MSKIDCLSSRLVVSTDLLLRMVITYKASSTMNSKFAM